MKELNRTMSLTDFEEYCSDINKAGSYAFEDLYQAGEVALGEVTVDITYRVKYKTEQDDSYSYFWTHEDKTCENLGKLTAFSSSGTTDE